MRALIAVALLSSVADAEPDRKAYAAALAKGRALQAKKEWKASIAAFDDALKILKDDPTALGELGWSAYNAKDYQRAVEATSIAAHSNAPAAQRGATYYNLALIREATHDLVNARADYAESLRLRWNDTVFAALVKLDPVGATEFDPFHAAAMSGPFESVAAYCKTLPKTEQVGVTGDGGYVRACACAERKVAAQLAAPYTGLAIAASHCGGTPPARDDEFGHEDVAIAVRTAAGWFVQPLERREFGRNCYTADQRFDVTAKVADVIPGGQPELLATAKSSGTCWHGDEDWDDAMLVVVGVGKTVDATRFITKRFDRSSKGSDGRWELTDADLELRVAWKPDGKVEITGRTTGLDKATGAKLLGTHAITFP